jgi:hypothetical protein
MAMLAFCSHTPPTSLTPAVLAPSRCESSFNDASASWSHVAPCDTKTPVASVPEMDTGPVCCHVDPRAPTRTASPKTASTAPYPTSQHQLHISHTSDRDGES